MTKLLVVNLHGLINVPGRTRNAIQGLGITKKFSATVVPDDESTIGTLKRCKDYLAWSEIDQETLLALIKRRARVSQRKRLDEPSLESLGFKDYESLASKIIAGDGRLSSVKGILPYFNLAPPKGGFKRSTRRQFREGGTLGFNTELVSIVRRMF
jgi:large subunit ribosomal protein L30